MQMRSLAQRFVLYALFALSGFAGLIYESIWSHYLKLFLGHAAYAQALVIVIFMGGMAAGAWMSSGLSRRAANPLLVYAGLEAFLGLAGLSFDPLYRGIMDAEHASPEHTPADAITAAARQVADTIAAAAIVTYTTSGSTALRAARERPRAPILCLTPHLDTARRLTLAWGIHGVARVDATNFSDMVEKACRAALREGFASSGQALVITAGVPFGTPGGTNILRLAWIP